MKLTATQVRELQAMSQKGLPCDKPASAWITRLAEEEGIGSLSGKKCFFTAKDLNKIAVFLRVNGYAQTVTETDFADRLTLAAKLNDEKLANQPVSQGRVMVKSFAKDFVVANQRFPSGHGIEFQVNELLNADIKQWFLVENLAVFLAIEQYPNLLNCLDKDCLVLYRGHGMFTAQASQSLLRQSNASKIGFFDFDPAGLCQIGMSDLDALILPALDEANVKRLIEANKSGVFADQAFQYAKQLKSLIDTNSPLSPWASVMFEHQLAVMQETLLARDVSLTRQTLNVYIPALLA